MLLLKQEEHANYERMMQLYASTMEDKRTMLLHDIREKTMCIIYFCSKELPSTGRLPSRTMINYAWKAFFDFAFLSASLSREYVIVNCCREYSLATLLVCLNLDTNGEIDLTSIGCDGNPNIDARMVRFYITTMLTKNIVYSQATPYSLMSVIIPGLYTNDDLCLLQRLSQCMLALLSCNNIYYTLPPTLTACAVAHLIQKKTSTHLPSLDVFPYTEDMKRVMDLFESIIITAVRTKDYCYEKILAFFDLLFYTDCRRLDKYDIPLNKITSLVS